MKLHPVVEYIIVMAVFAIAVIAVVRLAGGFIPLLEHLIGSPS